MATLDALVYAETGKANAELSRIMQLTETLKKELLDEGQKIFRPGDEVGVHSHGDMFFGFVREHTPEGVFVSIRDDFGQTEIFVREENVFRLP
jgi:hypothetical protein